MARATRPAGIRFAAGRARIAYTVRVRWPGLKCDTPWGAPAHRGSIRADLYLQPAEALKGAAAGERGKETGYAGLARCRKALAVRLPAWIRILITQLRTGSVRRALRRAGPMPRGARPILIVRIVRASGCPGVKCTNLWHALCGLESGQ